MDVGDFGNKLFFISKVVSAAKRLVIIDNYITEKSPPGTTSRLARVTDIGFSYSAKSPQENYADKIMNGKFWKKIPKKNMKQITLSSPSRVCDHNESTVSKTSVDRKPTFSVEKAKHVLIKREVKSLLNDVVGAVVMAEELSLHAFKSEPDVSLVCNLSKAHSQEPLPKEVDHDPAKPSKSQKLKPVSSESSTTEYSSYDPEKLSSDGCNQSTNANLENR